MKKFSCFLIITAFFISCQEDIKVNHAKLDKLNGAGKDLQKVVKKSVDTVASKVKRIKIKIEEK